MKISFLSPVPNLSGGERVIAIYTRELNRRGHDVRIYCERPKQRRLRSRMKSFVQGNGWPPKQSIGVSHYDNYRVPYAICSHPGPLTETDIPDADVIIATFWPTADWLQNFGDSKGTKIYLIQSDEGALHGLMAEKTYQYNMLQIYVSDWIRSRISKRFPGSRGYLIPNAVDVEQFDLGVRRKPDKFTVGLTLDENRIKGSDLAIEAVRLLRKQGTAIRFVAYGASTPSASLLKEFDEFTYQPSEAKLAEIYRECTAWLFPSRFEGFGLPILESMAARTPVIGTATGAASELIQPGGGILVDLEDYQGLATAILEISGLTPIQWSRMSDKAYQTATSHTWQDACDAFESILSDAVGKR